MQIRSCAPWALALVVVVTWSAAVWAQRPAAQQRPGGRRPGAGFQGGRRGGARFGQMLERHDKNEDGKVSREEWQGPEQFFGRMDQNGDGEITREEFEAQMRRRAGGPGRFPRQGFPPSGPRGLDAPGLLLRLLDADRDRSVSKEELEKFFQKYDSDEDDSLSIEELREAVASQADDDAAPIEGPSVVEGQEAGIGVGDYAPDFELQPVEPHPSLRKWLGDDAPESIENNVKLSELVGKAPIMLFFGNYT